MPNDSFGITPNLKNMRHPFSFFGLEANAIETSIACLYKTTMSLYYSTLKQSSALSFALGIDLS